MHTRKTLCWQKFPTLPKRGLVCFADISKTLKDSISLAQYLLEHGADPNDPSDEFWGIPRTPWQAEDTNILQSLLDPSLKRRLALVAKVSQEQLDNITSTASPSTYYSRGSWLGELARLRYIHVVPVDLDEEMSTKLDEFMDPRFPRSQEQIRWFDTLTEKNRTSPSDESTRNAAIVHALKDGRLREPNGSSQYFRTMHNFAYDLLSTGLKFFVPPRSAQAVELCIQKDYLFERLIVSGNFPSRIRLYPSVKSWNCN